MSELPPPEPPADGDRSPVAPMWISTDELLFRFQRLFLAMTLVAVVLALSPVPAYVTVIALLALPMFVLVAAITSHDTRRSRYARVIWEYRRDPAGIVVTAERTREPFESGLRRAWLLLGLFAGVFVAGLMLAGISVGVSEAIYG